MATAFKPLVNFQGGLNMEPFFPRKDKVVFVVGPTGTRKSRLAIDLAARYPAEVVNCDKMQVYKGVDVVTNKVTPEECQGVKHHLPGIVEPNTDFTSDNFKHRASVVVESIAKGDRLPIIAGGSKSYIEALVNDDEDREFRLRRAIGVPELDQYLRCELGSYTNARPEPSFSILPFPKSKRTLAYSLVDSCRRSIVSIASGNGTCIELTPQKCFLEADETWDMLVLRPSACLKNLVWELIIRTSIWRACIKNGLGADYPY